MHQYRTHNCGELTEVNMESRVRLSGWIHSKRDHGSLLFIDLRDESRSILKRFNRDLDAGKPFFNVDVPRIEKVTRMMDRFTSRVSLALISSSLVIGSAIINMFENSINFSKNVCVMFFNVSFFF